MTTPTRAFDSRLSQWRHRLLITPAQVVGVWAVAALLVVVCHRTLGSVSIAASVTLKAIAILASGFVYMRLLARDATVEHALLVGATWLLLDIGAEIAIASTFGTHWYLLLGSPAYPIFRDVLLVSWVAAPAVFARGGS
jgi:hypothetical protein